MEVAISEGRLKIKKKQILTDTYRGGDHSQSSGKEEKTLKMEP
jgi:hypothetical protein